MATLQTICKEWSSKKSVLEVANALLTDYESWTTFFCLKKVTVQRLLEEAEAPTCPFSQSVEKCSEATIFVVAENNRMVLRRCANKVVGNQVDWVNFFVFFSIFNFFFYFWAASTGILAPASALHPSYQPVPARPFQHASFYLPLQRGRSNTDIQSGLNTVPESPLQRGCSNTPFQSGRLNAGAPARRSKAGKRPFQSARSSAAVLKRRSRADVTAFLSFQSGCNSFFLVLERT